MHNQTWLLSIFVGIFLINFPWLMLNAAERGKSRVSSTTRTGDINVINSQVMIGGNSVSSMDSELVIGNGKRITKVIPVAEEFHGINLSGVFKAEVVCGSAVLVEVLIDENLQSLIKATVQNGILSIRFNKPVQTKTNPQLKIVVPTLDILQMSGSDAVCVTNVKGKRFQLMHEGTEAVKLAGQVEDLICTVSGIGEVDASKLKCRLAEVAISGVGGVSCRPEAKLKVNLSGIGGVRCLTQPPTVEKQATGLGEVEFVGK